MRRIAKDAVVVSGPDVWVTLIRHQQTACSVANVYCGRHCDPGLTPRGTALANSLADTLASQHWDGLYASPQRRALQTIAPLARRVGRTVHVLDGLAELDYGTWDGHSQTTLQASQALHFNAWRQDPARLAPPGGENAVALFRRAHAALAHVVQTHANPTRQGSMHVLLVAHKSTLRVLLSGLLGLDLAGYRHHFAWPLGASTLLQLTRKGLCVHFPGGVHNLCGAPPPP